MPFARPLIASAALLLFSGCGYVHFGRLPKMGPADPALAAAYSDLSTENKILKQELALARREGDALRATVDRAGSPGASAELVARLNETTRELATLRASYAKLQAERGAAPAAAANPASRAQATELEERLAAALRDFTRLQEENSRLRTDLDRAREQNTGLAEQLKTAVMGREEAQAALSQLNTELLAQKEARARAEQAGAAVRAQLSTVLAAGGTVAPTPPPATRPEPAAVPASATSALRLAKAPPADAFGVAELRTSPERLRTAESAPPPAGGFSAAPTAPTATPTRIHVVQAGDTLEKLALRYYNAPGQWLRIYEANTDLLGNGQPLAVGMRLEVPGN
jgi:nucleoid-associated protein YgaU